MSRPAVGFLFLAPAVFCCACIGYVPDTPKLIQARSTEAERLRSMMQVSSVGPLQISSLVYKPRVLPLSGFLKRLARGDFKNALQARHLRYAPSNIDDEVLKRLVSKGYVPVLVNVVNTSTATVDAHSLKLSLTDSRLDLTPLSDAELPTAFKDLRPQAAVTDVYNVTLAVVGTVTLMTVIAACVVPEWHYEFSHPGPGAPQAWEATGGAATSRSLNRDWERSNGQYNSFSAIGSPHAYTQNKSADGPTFDSVVQGPWDSDGYFAGMDISTDNDVLYPLVKTSKVDYNGLLFHPSKLAPGERSRGLLFFKAKGVDWTDLELKASLP